MKKRIFYIISFLVIFCIEVFIALYVRDSFVRPYMGDALVVVLVYSFVRIFIPTGVPVCRFTFSCSLVCRSAAIFSSWLETWDHQPCIKNHLGSTFDWKDIVCYGAGCILIFLFEQIFRRH